MQVSFLLNRPNGSILSPIPCSAREEREIIPFLITSIYNCSQLSPLIVSSLCKLLSLYKSSSLFSHCTLTATMSSKSSKVDKTKHDVKVMGLKKGSSASPSSPKAPVPVEFQESLPVQPYSYEPSISVKPDFAKKKFKTGTSKRYRSSLMGSSSIPTSAPVTV